MFVSREDVKAKTGYDVTQENLALAQLMIETFIGRSEAQVDDAEDRETLSRATAFQAVYIRDSVDIILEQAAVSTIVLADATTKYDIRMFAPYMSPWAVLACRGLSWLGTRTVHTGPIFDGPGTLPEWERD